MNKVKGILFDMDGVLIDAREWHYLALNDALLPFGYEISEHDHHTRFDGLSTRVKLNMLSQEEGLPRHLHPLISRVKQDRTIRFSYFSNYPNVGIQILLNRLTQKKILLGVVTNSIRQTTEIMLDSAAIKSYFDVVITNEDVKLPKPDPEGYMMACQRLNLNPSSVLVIEDGEYGAEAAAEAGCKVLKVADPYEVNLALVLPHIPDLLL